MSVIDVSATKRDIPGSSVSGKVITWRMQGAFEGGRSYSADTLTGLLVALVTQDEVKPGKKLWHISVSHRNFQGNPDRCPDWDEIKSAKYELVPVDIPMVLIFPRTTVPYLDDYKTCLHLWESTDKDVDL